MRDTLPSHVLYATHQVIRSNKEEATERTRQKLQLTRVTHEENSPLQIKCGFLARQTPPLAKVLVDAVGYVYLVSMQCDDCMYRTLADEFTLSLAETLNQD